MSWKDLHSYELRHLPAHLAMTSRWDDLRDIIFDTGYLRVALRALGVFDLTQLISELVDLNAPPDLHSTLPALRRLIINEASFLASPQYAGYEGPFSNHLGIATRRDSRTKIRLAFFCDLADVGQEGWLDLETYHGASIGQVKRFFMPGDRTSYGWDPTYSSGAAGVEMSFAVDLRRMRLLAELISLHYDDYVKWRPRHYHWRIWDLESGSLLLERSATALSYQGTRQWNGEDMSGGARPGAFEVPELAWAVKKQNTWGAKNHFSKEPPELLADRFKGPCRTVITCANGPERLFAGNDTQDVHRSIVTDGDCGAILVDAVIPRSIEPRLLIRRDGKFTLFGTSYEEHIYCIDLESETAKDDRPSPHPSTVDYSLADDGLLTWAPLSWDGDNHSFARKDFNKPHRLADVLQSHLQTPALFEYGCLPDSSYGMRVTRDGRFVFENRQTSIGVWDRDSGRWICQLRTTETDYGGGGVLGGGFAVSPDGRHLIVSYYQTICVWNLDELVTSKSKRRMHLPHWRLDDVEIPDPLTSLGFLWGGQLVAAVTQTHELLVLRFWQRSAILARVGLSDTASLRCQAYGPMIKCVSASEQTASIYRFRYLPKAHVSTLNRNLLTVRLQRRTAQSVSVAGTFTGWFPYPLERGPDDIWSAEFELTSGLHEYKLLVDESRWVVDPHIPCRPGPMSQNNYIVIFPEI